MTVLNATWKRGGGARELFCVVLFPRAVAAFAFFALLRVPFDDAAVEP